jgi:hypothetical protein
MDNFETLNEFYGVDTPDEQYVIQNFYHRFGNMCEDGSSNWTQIFLDKKRIIWKNPANGFAIAALKELDREIRLPNYLPSYEENFESFKSMWTSLDYDIKILFENVKSHVKSDEYCCSMKCEFPFAPVCAELYSQFEPDPSNALPP